MQIEARAERWPIRGAFTIARGSKTEAEVVVVEVEEGGVRGRGECLPYPRYGESVEGVVAQVAAVPADGLTRARLQGLLPAGAARNAIDCALWDLEAKRSGRRVWQLAGLPEPGPVITAFTLGLDTPERMGAAARENALRPLLKLKLSGAGDLERVRAVRANAPNAALIIDANEAWSVEDYRLIAPKLARLGVTMIEQPFPAGQDGALAELPRPVPVCADESCHTGDDLARLAGAYDAVNIKLDKAGGLTEALSLKRAAQAMGFRIMIGCMVATSLSMAPAQLIAQGADWADLDGPLLLAEDRSPGLLYRGSTVYPPEPALWG
ncbi:MAG: Mandelate racemase/muconate lactonizing protein [Rhodospirillales bacterium]|nr:Mandelate racemase/muconate lactonizing protein [Rhodospirillales bacterium]